MMVLDQPFWGGEETFFLDPTSYFPSVSSEKVKIYYFYYLLLFYYVLLKQTFA